MFQNDFMNVLENDHRNDHENVQQNDFMNVLENDHGNDHENDFMNVLENDHENDFMNVLENDHRNDHENVQQNDFMNDFMNVRENDHGNDQQERSRERSAERFHEERSLQCACVEVLHAAHIIMDNLSLSPDKVEKAREAIDFLSSISVSRSASIPVGQSDQSRAGPSSRAERNEGKDN